MNDELKIRTLASLNELGYYYNIEEVIGHLTAFDSENENILTVLLEMNSDDFLSCIENACNIIDLNNEE
jgi:hypothetical protein